MSTRGKRALWLALVLIAIFIAVTQCGCGPSSTSVAIRSEVGVLRVARTEFIKYDRAAQLAMVERAEREHIPQDIARASVTAYRDNIRDVVIAAFAGVYELLADAAGDDGGKDALAKAVAAAAQLAHYIDKLEVGHDPSPPPCEPPCSRF